MENGARIYDRHMQIENEEDLLDYLYDIFDSNYKNDYLDITVENDPRDRSQDLISGYLNNVYFEITFTARRYMALRISGKSGTREETMLKRALGPVMWNIDEYSKAPVIHSGEREITFSAPIYEADYTKYDMHEVVWDTFDPEDSLKEILFSKNILEEGVQNLVIHHPLFDENELIDELKVGAYPACLKPEFVESLDGKTEFEMFLLISGKRKEIMDCSSQNLAVGEEPDQSELLIKYYQLYYLINKACKMFGIKCNPPSDDSFDLTKEYKAWERWWSDGMTEALTKQETFDDVTMGKYGYNPTFRPKGSYKDLLKKDVKGSAQSKPDDKQDDIKQK